MMVVDQGNSSLRSLPDGVSSLERLQILSYGDQAGNYSESNNEDDDDYDDDDHDA